MRPLLLVLLLALAGSTSAQELVSPVGPKHEFRGAWIATVINLDWPNNRNSPPSFQQAELVRMFDALKEAGVNAAIFQVRSEADAMYVSEIEPWSYWLTGEQGTAPDPVYDPLALAVELAHERGMELHAWFNPYRADRGSSYPKAPSHVTNTHPEWMLEVGNLKIFDPGLQESRDRAAAVMADVARRYDVDGVHIDDYFYPYPPNNLPNTTTAADSASFRLYPRGFTNIADWRRDNVNLMVAQVQDSLLAVDPSIKWGVSPFGIWRNGVPAGITGLDSYATIYADARAWLDAQTIDYLAPQTYWAFGGGQDFGRLAPWWGSVRGDRHVYPGLGVYRSDNNTFSGALFAADEIPRQIRLTRDDANLGGHILFRAKNITVYTSRGIRDSLESDLYRRAALTPPMAWKSQIAPEMPGELVSSWDGDELTLRWSPAADGPGAEARRYAVYRIPSPAPPSFPDALGDAENLIEVTGDTMFVDRPVIAPDPYTYVVTAVSANSIESVPSNPVVVDGRAVSTAPTPDAIADLLAPRPNPTPGRTEIAFSLASPARVTLRVLDVLGREVARLSDDEPRAAGLQSLTWDGRSTSGGRVASGTYLVVLDAEGVRRTRPLTLVR